MSNLSSTRNFLIEMYQKDKDKKRKKKEKKDKDYKYIKTAKPKEETVTHNPLTGKKYTQSQLDDMSARKYLTPKSYRRLKSMQKAKAEAAKPPKRYWMGKSPEVKDMEAISRDRSLDSTKIKEPIRMAKKGSLNIFRCGFKDYLSNVDDSVMYPIVKSAITKTATAPVKPTSFEDAFMFKCGFQDMVKEALTPGGLLGNVRKAAKRPITSMATSIRVPKSIKPPTISGGNIIAPAATPAAEVAAQKALRSPKRVISTPGIAPQVVPGGTVKEPRSMFNTNLPKPNPAADTVAAPAAPSANLANSGRSAGVSAPVNNISMPRQTGAMPRSAATQQVAPKPAKQVAKEPAPTQKIAPKPKQAKPTQATIKPSEYTADPTAINYGQSTSSVRQVPAQPAPRPAAKTKASAPSKPAVQPVSVGKKGKKSPQRVDLTDQSVREQFKDTPIKQWKNMTPEETVLVEKHNQMVRHRKNQANTGGQSAKQSGSNDSGSQANAQLDPEANWVAPAMAAGGLGLYGLLGD
jgi:hypothetical protein